MGTIEEYWSLVVDVWNSGFMGIDISRIIIAAGILLFAIIVRRLFGYFVIKQIKFWTKRSKTTLDDNIVEALESPIRFIPIVIAVYVIAGMIDGGEDASHVLAQINRSLIILVIFWTLYELVEPVTRLLDGARHLFTKPMIDWITKSGKLLFAALGAATILEVWGIEVGPILAGLGLFGVAVALGAQDLFKNVISGIFIIGERRFLDGDWIKVEGIAEGFVEGVGFRTTCIRQFDKAPIYVPNAKLADDAVTNYSKMLHRRIFWIIGVEYRTTADQLKEICRGIKEFLEGDDEFAQAPDVPLQVRVDSFNDSSIDIMVYCFSKSIDWNEWLKCKEKLAYAIKEIVEGAGTAFAFPSQSLYVETLPEGAEPYRLPTPEAGQNGGSSSE